MTLPIDSPGDRPGGSSPDKVDPDDDISSRTQV